MQVSSYLNSGHLSLPKDVASSCLAYLINNPAAIFSLRSCNRSWKALIHEYLENNKIYKFSFHILSNFQKGSYFCDRQANYVEGDFYLTRAKIKDHDGETYTRIIHLVPDKDKFLVYNNLFDYKTHPLTQQMTADCGFHLGEKKSRTCTFLGSSYTLDYSTQSITRVSSGETTPLPLKKVNDIDQKGHYLIAATESGLVFWDTVSQKVSHILRSQKWTRIAVNQTQVQGFCPEEFEGAGGLRTLEFGLSHSKPSLYDQYEVLNRLKKMEKVARAIGGFFKRLGVGFIGGGVIIINLIRSFPKPAIIIPPALFALSFPALGLIVGASLLWVGLLLVLGVAITAALIIGGIVLGVMIPCAIMHACKMISDADFKLNSQDY